jgi:methyl-accepting chemotaxis protein
VETQARNPETIDTRLLLKVLMAFKKGDFSARLPVEKTGTLGKIYDALNDVVERNENMTNESVRVYDSVANEGKIGERAALSGANGSWSIDASSMEGMIEGLKSSGT